MVILPRIPANGPPLVRRTAGSGGLIPCVRQDPLEKRNENTQCNKILMKLTKLMGRSRSPMIVEPGEISNAVCGSQDSQCDPRNLKPEIQPAVIMKIKKPIHLAKLTAVVTATLALAVWPMSWLNAEVIDDFNNGIADWIDTVSFGDDSWEFTETGGQLKITAGPAWW